METATITNSTIEIIETYFPEETLHIPRHIHNHATLFNFSFKINRVAEGSHKIRFFIDMLFYNADDPDKKSILNLKTCSCFDIKCEANTEIKLLLFYELLSMSFWNFQGVFAAKTQGTRFSTEIPPIIDFTEHEDEFRTRIEYEWN